MRGLQLLRSPVELVKVTEIMLSSQGHGEDCSIKEEESTAESTLYIAVDGERASIWLLGMKIPETSTITGLLWFEARFFTTKLKMTELLAGISELMFKINCPPNCLHIPVAPSCVEGGLNIIAGSSGVSVVTIPDIVTLGEHDENIGTLACSVTVIVLQSQGRVELCENCDAKKTAV